MARLDDLDRRGRRGSKRSCLESRARSASEHPAPYARSWCTNLVLVQRQPRRPWTETGLGLAVVATALIPWPGPTEPSTSPRIWAVRQQGWWWESPSNRESGGHSRRAAPIRPLPRRRDVAVPVVASTLALVAAVTGRGRIPQRFAVYARARPWSQPRTTQRPRSPDGPVPWRSTASRGPSRGGPADREPGEARGVSNGVLGIGRRWTTWGGRSHCGLGWCSSTRPSSTATRKRRAGWRWRSARPSSETAC